VARFDRGRWLFGSWSIGFEVLILVPLADRENGSFRSLVVCVITLKAVERVLWHASMEHQWRHAAAKGMIREAAQRQTPTLKN